MMEEQTQPQKNKETLSDWEYEISKLRRDFDKFQDKIIEMVQSFKTDVNSLRGSINRSGGMIAGYTVKELLTLKQLGINPKDLITPKSIETHG